MDIDPETTKKIQDLQVLEQNLQAILSQKQAIQLDQNETNNALSELKKSKDEVFKIVSGIMIKSTPPELQKDLEERKKLIDLRISSIEKQETLLQQNATTLRDEINKVMTEKSPKKEKSK
jgi:prefoldin beta subunit